MSDLAIRVMGLGKEYQISARASRHKTLRESLMQVFDRPFRRMRHYGESHVEVNSTDKIWALKDVSFDVKQGEVVGVIGRNGAGKSTLLKILSRITEPTKGCVEIRGRVGALLEVGTGFHSELTGRENIYLNGAILGMRQAEIARKFDEIVDFAEVAKFIDTPVKHYSSGMYMRLAFAVAAHLEPEILLVDEVLAVGDFAFQAKCLGRMHALSQEGRTVLLVTHNIAVVSKLCQRAILLGDGGLITAGDTQEVVGRYLHTSQNEAPDWVRQPGVMPSRGIVVTRIRVLDSDGHLAYELPSNQPSCIEVTYVVLGANVQSRIVLEIETQDGTVVFATTDCDVMGGTDIPRIAGLNTCRCILPPHLLAPGAYYVTAAASWTRQVEWDRVLRAVEFHISPVGSLSIIDRRPGVVAPILNWERVGT